MAAARTSAALPRRRRCRPPAAAPLRLLLLAALGRQCRSQAAATGCPTDFKTKVFAHYMIWYGQPNTRIWKWANRTVFDPLTMGCNNTEHLATFFPPVSGSFASYDGDHIRRDLELMKANCIDGIIIDYQQPSTDRGRDIQDLAFPLLIRQVAAAGLEFAIMYDTSNMENWGLDSPNTTKAQWKLITQMSTSHSSYLRDNSSNMLFFAFGRTPLPPAGTVCQGCVFYTQDWVEAAGRGSGSRRAGEVYNPAHFGSFAWVTTTKGPQLDQLDRFYERRCRSAFPDTPVPCVGAAYAGFQGTQGVFPPVPRSADLFRDTLVKCGQSADICQIVTWNDFTEGTHIQPSYWCDGRSPEAYVSMVRAFKLGELFPQAAAGDPEGRPLWVIIVAALCTAVACLSSVLCGFFLCRHRGAVAAWAAKREWPASMRSRWSWPPAAAPSPARLGHRTLQEGASLEA